jgi:hypothetical protein
VTSDKRTTVVRLVHYTSQAFLEGKLGKREANAEIARASLRQLVLTIQRDQLGPHEYSSACRLTLEASRHWSHHVRQGGEEDLQMDIIEAFRTQALRNRLCQLSQKFGTVPFDLSRGEDTSLLQIACMFGLPKLCRGLLWSHPPQYVFSLYDF